MSIESIQSKIRGYDREIEALSAEIRELIKEMDRVVEAQSQVTRKEKDFHNYLDRERGLATKMKTNERVKVAVGFGNRMNTIITGTKYRSAMSSIDGIKRTLTRRKSEIESRITQCRRRISSLQDSIRNSNIQISKLSEVK